MFEPRGDHRDRQEGRDGDHAPAVVLPGSVKIIIIIMIIIRIIMVIMIIIIITITPNN